MVGKFNSYQLEDTRNDGLRPIVSRSFSMLLETCFAARPPPYIVLLLLNWYFFFLMVLHYGFQLAGYILRININLVPLSYCIKNQQKPLSCTVTCIIIHPCLKFRNCCLRCHHALGTAKINSPAVDITFN
jgi:membrane associated rhomboid family serine protease